MYDVVTTPRGPHPIDTYRGAPPPAQGNWKEHKSRRQREAEVFQDLQRHPSLGIRQAGKAVNLYGMTSRSVDQELRKVPYETRLHHPPAGTFPLIVGREIGTGPNPWEANTDVDHVIDRMRGRDHWREHYSWDGGKWGKPLQGTPNKANYEDGPAVTLRNRH